MITEHTNAELEQAVKLARVAANMNDDEQRELANIIANELVDDLKKLATCETLADAARWFNNRQLQYDEEMKRGIKQDV